MIFFCVAFLSYNGTVPTVTWDSLAANKVNWSGWTLRLLVGHVVLMICSWPIEFKQSPSFEIAAWSRAAFRG